jgi:peroxiredoxin/mono/diheme cytochrome c family protein
MRQFGTVRGACYLAVTLLATSAAFATLAKANVPVGTRVPNFVLADAAGQTQALADFRDQKAVVLVFLGTECPVANLYVPDLVAMQEKYRDQGVRFIAINANPTDTAEEIAKHAEEYGLKLPVWIDAGGRVARTLGVTRTPEVLLLDDRAAVRYRGRIDDRYGVDYKRNEATRHDLAEAIDEHLAGKPVTIAETEPVGCLITFPSAKEINANVTYSKEVARIVQENCQKCHHAGTAAPFEMLSFDDVMNHGEMIKEVVQRRQMPPWHADPRYGTFSNDRRLTEQEIDTLVAWVDAGMPRGDDKDLPPTVEYADGWTIGKPDIIFEMPEEVSVPASGTVPYRYFTTETNFEEDVWIQAAEARPGNRAAVHHIIAFYQEPGKEPSRRFEDQWIVATAPGDMPLVLPPGVARKIPKGSKIVWQMHYTPTGKEETDRSQIGLILYKGDEPPKYEARTRGLANVRLQIPPGASHHEVKSQLTVPADVYLLSFSPHMHVRGKDFEYKATFPDGKQEVLLSVPQYDFNWQSTYRLPEPRFVPKGTKIQCVAHYDNSPNNPANPDPKIEVHWGDQTWEEMMIGYLDYMLADGVPKEAADKAAPGEDVLDTPKP